MPRPSATQAQPPAIRPTLSRTAYARPAVAIAPIRGRRGASRRCLLSAPRRSVRRCATPPRCPRSGPRPGSGSPLCTCGESAGGPACCLARSSSTGSFCSTTARSPSEAFWASRRATWRRSSWARCCCADSLVRTPRWTASSRSAACSSPLGSRPRSARRRARSRWSPAGWSMSQAPQSSGAPGGSADTSGGLVVLPLMLAWAHDPVGAWRRIRTWEGAAVIAGVTALSVVAFSTRGTDQVHRVSGADLGGFPIRPSGRDAVRSRSPPVWRSAKRRTTSGPSPSSPSTTAHSARSSTSGSRH